MHFSNVVFALLMCAIEVDHWRQRHGRFGGEPMASAEREPITGGLGAEPPAGSEGRGPGQGVRGRSPPEAESFTTFGHPIEAITFMPFAIFCKLGTHNLGYTMSRQDLTKFYIWQIFSLPPHLKVTTTLLRKY